MNSSAIDQRFSTMNDSYFHPLSKPSTRRTYDAELHQAVGDNVAGMLEQSTAQHGSDLIGHPQRFTGCISQRDARSIERRGF
jgi:hypothetical protein